MRVPSYDGLNVGASTLPQVSFRPAVIDGSGANKAAKLQEFKAVTVDDISGKQLQKTGDALQRAGNNLASIQIEAEKEVAQVRIDDALNRAKEAANRLTFDKDAGYTNIKGLSALERQSGRSLEDEYTENLTKEFQAIGEGLGTDMQKRMFAQRASEMATNFRAGVTRHTSDQFQTYQLSVADGITKTALNDIGLNYNNPKAVEEAVTRIKAQTYQTAKLQGKSAEWQEAQARGMVSSAHKVALMSALDKNDVEYAQGYLTKFSKDMEADDLLHVKGLITKEMSARVGLTASDEIIRKVTPTIAPTESERAFNILLGTESNGKQFGKDGKPLTSKAGAIGIAQVMPATGPEAAKIAGMKWDETRYRNDPEYNKALGRAYFGQQLKDFNGDLAMAYAAYNAGPGRLKQAITQTRKEGGDWLSKMPAETQAYVAKNMKEYESGSGKPKTVTFDEIDNELRKDPRLANNPEAYKIARSNAEKQYNDSIKAKKQLEEEAVNNALEAVEKNGGNYASLPLAMRNAIPADKRDTVMNFADRVAKGKDVQTDPNVYYVLTLAAAENPQAFRGEDLRKYYDKLSPSDRKHFMDLQGKKDDDMKDISSATQQKDALAKTLGLKNEKLGLFHQEADKALMAATRNKGKELTQEERQKVLDRLVLQGSDGGWFSSKMYQFEANAKGEQISIKFTDDQKRKATEALKRRGVNKPSDSQVEAVLRAQYQLTNSGATGSF